MPVAWVWVGDVTVEIDFFEVTDLMTLVVEKREVAVAQTNFVDGTHERVALVDWGRNQPGWWKGGYRSRRPVGAAVKSGPAATATRRAFPTTA